MSDGVRLRRPKWSLALPARNSDEAHRGSSPLELLFDLCFVVAVSQAGRELNSYLDNGRVGHAVFSYILVFFGIWWAWVNFTWFASAYDADDLTYRLLTFVQIVGVLVLAAGVPRAFAHGDFVTMTLGYLITRAAMLIQWLRAAAGDPARRGVALRYAVGITVVQLGWVGRLFLSRDAGLVGFGILALAEMLIPAWAERHGAPNGELDEASAGSTWHPGHIAERYGLFTIIVLGECVEAATVTIQAVDSAHGLPAGLLGVAAGGVLMVFAMWWWYFEHPAEEALRASRSSSFLWGYVHYFVFASAAALGAGLELSADHLGLRHSASAEVAGLTVAVAVCVYLLTTGFLHTRIADSGGLPLWKIAPFLGVILVLGACASVLSVGLALPLMGAVTVALVAADQVTTDRHSGLSQPI
jgi:low temperature requirement protein LtrA